jgi:putative FmdB family regulatory protein
VPLYDYACEACEKTTEILQRFDDPPLEICPHCGGALRKLLSAPAFQFKGSGWYVTDYARQKGGADSPAASSESTTSESASGESKSAEKSDAKKSESSPAEEKKPTTTSSPGD